MTDKTLDEEIEFYATSYLIDNNLVSLVSKTDVKKIVAKERDKIMKKIKKLPIVEDGHYYDNDIFEAVESE